jgi:zinc protease
MKRGLVCGVLLAVASWPARAADDIMAPHFPLVSYQLDNGLQVLLHEDHTVPLVHVNIWYHVGSGDEVPGKGGLAHFCEHMMFEGSKHVAPGEHFRVLGSAGDADANATTSSDRTNYFETVPTHQLETVLWLESDRMGYLAGSLDQARFDNQREVVRNERRQRYENVAYGAERLAIAEALYPEGHPYRHLTIGLHEDLQRETLDDASAFLRKWYVPSNATLVIAGDIDVARTRAMVDKWFATLPKRPRPTHTVLTTPPLTGPRRMVVQDPFTSLRRIHYVWPGAKALSNDDVTLDVAASILGRLSTGRLYVRLVVGQLAQAAGAYNPSNNFSGEFHVYVDLRPDVDLTMAEATLNDELDRISSQPVDPRELARVVAATEASLVAGLETLEARAASFQSYNHYRQNPDSFAWSLATTKSVTPASLQATTRRILGPGRVEVITMPGGP